MTALVSLLRPRSSPARRQALGFDEWAGMFSYDNFWPLIPTTMNGVQERVDVTFPGLVYGTYLRNSVVFSCLTVRARLFSEARFQFQQLRGGRPGNLFGTPALSIVERPEPGKTTGDMLTTAILDADLGGNAFLLGRSNAIRRLRPDWTTIVWGSTKRPDLGAWDPDAQVIGYGHEPGGPSAGNDWLTFGPEEVCHFAPTRDPLARNRGISLLTAGLREIMADTAATSHKLAFFENAATPNLALKLPAGMSREKAEEWIELFEQDHRGVMNAYRTLWFGGGMEPAPVGLNFEQMTFQELQGKAETRIAALTGVHPVVVALSEGLQGSSLNSGNFSAAARLVGNATLRPLWRNFAASLETILPPLPGTRLWYDDRDVPFLREDIKDRAAVTQNEASTIQTLINTGFVPATVIDAVSADGDWGRLQHTGLTSVQLQPPPSEPWTGQTPPPPAQPAAAATVAELTRSGYMPVGATDAAAIEALAWSDWPALERLGVRTVNLRPPATGPVAVSGSWRARVAFTGSGGPKDATAAIPLGPFDNEAVEAGAILPGHHPFVRAFPSLFEPEADGGRANGPGAIVTRDQVVAMRTDLIRRGQPAGRESIARALSVSPDTVRRRLAGQ